MEDILKLTIQCSATALLVGVYSIILIVGSMGAWEGLYNIWTWK